MIDFFVSYTKEDSDWAQWVAWQLEEAGYSTFIQAWDILPANEILHCMNQAFKQTTRLLPILSESYFKSKFCNLEWQTYKSKDPNGTERLIAPVIVGLCDGEMLRNLSRCNLLGFTEAEKASQKLISFIKTFPKLSKVDSTKNKIEYEGHRLKPNNRPNFPATPTEMNFIPNPIDYSHLKFFCELEGARDELFSIAFSPDGNWIASGSNGEVLLWNTVILREKNIHVSSESVIIEPSTSFDNQGKFVYSIAFSNDSRKLAIGCEDGYVRVWDIDKKIFLWQERRHKEAVYSVAFSPDGVWVASGGYDKHIHVWEAERGKLIRSNEHDLGDVGRVTSIAFSPIDGKMLAVGSLDDTVRLWNIREGWARILGRHKSSVEGVAFSPDGRFIASCGLDKAVRIWDIQNKRRPLKWFKKKHEYIVRSVAFSPDGKTLASVGWDKTLNLWEVESGENFWNMPLVDNTPGHWHSDWVWSVAFAPGGHHLASSGSDGRIIFWQIEPI